MERSASIELGYRKSTPLSDINETIIREAELNTLTLENNLSKTYNKSELSSKKRKRDINIYKYNSFVSITWKKNIINFFPELQLLLIKVF